MVYGKIYGICALVAAPFTGRVKTRAIIAPKRAPTGLKTAHNANKTNSDLRMSAFGGKADMIQDVAKSPLIANSGHPSDGETLGTSA